MEVFIVLMLVGLIAILYQDNYKLNRNMQSLQLNFKILQDEHHTLKDHYNDLDVQLRTHRQIAHNSSPTDDRSNQ